MTTEDIEVFTQSSIRIRAKEGILYLDPFRLQEEAHDADYILITHDQYDHFSPEDIRKAAGENTVLIVPEKMEQKAKKKVTFLSRICTVRPGEKLEIDGLMLETVPAYNMLKPFHMKSAGWVGYMIQLEDKRIYMAGDTDATKEAEQVKCDIALVPIGGFYTMEAIKAAELINRICPETAIPIHYGSIVGKPADAEVFAAHVKEPVKVEVKIKEFG